MRRSVILGAGHFLPEKCLTNADMTALVDTTD
jgi:3-oxoacyl-[acyl-carrier-protein] synthase III